MLKFFVPLRERQDLNTKEILQVKMDLASIFILLLNWVVLELLDCSKILDNSCSSEFSHSSPFGDTVF